MTQPQDEDLDLLILQHQEAVRQIYEGKYDHLLGRHLVTQSEGGGQQSEEAAQEVLDREREARRRAEEARQAALEALERTVEAAKEASITATRNLEEPRRAAQQAQQRFYETRRSAEDASWQPRFQEARQTTVAARRRFREAQFLVVRTMANEADALSAEISFWGTQIQHLVNEAQAMTESST